MLEFLTATWYLVEVFIAGGCVYGGVDMHACLNNYVVCESQFKCPRAWAVHGKTDCTSG